MNNVMMEILMMMILAILIVKLFFFLHAEMVFMSPDSLKNVMTIILSMVMDALLLVMLRMDGSVSTMISIYLFVRKKILNLHLHLHLLTPSAVMGFFNQLDKVVMTVITIMEMDVLLLVLSSHSLIV